MSLGIPPQRVSNLSTTDLYEKPLHHYLPINRHPHDDNVLHRDLIIAYLTSLSLPGRSWLTVIQPVLTVTQPGPTIIQLGLEAYTVKLSHGITIR